MNFQFLLLIFFLIGVYKCEIIQNNEQDLDIVYDPDELYDKELNNLQENKIDIYDDDDLIKYYNQAIEDAKLDTEETDIENEIKTENLNNLRNKRFLESIFGKKKTKTSPATTTLPTTTTTTTTLVTSKLSFNSNTNDYSNDAFYVLKQTCLRDPADSFCRKSKTNMSDLLKKCLDLKKTSTDGKLIPACKDFFSAFCYVYGTEEVKTCSSNEFEPYVPGKNVLTTSTTRFTVKSTTPSTRIIPIVTSYNSNDYKNDPFYQLKQKCMNNPFDSMCEKRKNEMHDLVKRCIDLKKTNKNDLPACKEILSAYCYVFSSEDIITCYLNEHEPYIPGKSISSTATTRSIYSSTSSTTTTTRPKSSTTSTTSTTTTTRYSSVAPPPPPPPKPPSSLSPFYLIPGFSGTVTSIPEDANVMKEIGNYCVKPGVKDSNCEKLLLLLKEKFKSCGNLPASDSGCQSFKLKFCGAFPNFQNCKKPNSRRMLLRALNRYIANKIDE